MSQRRHIVFDGTGKSILNTCGRIIGRLAAAGYRVHICIVLASCERCWERIEERRMITDRGVPKKVLQQQLQHSSNSSSRIATPSSHPPPFPSTHRYFR